jgi:hypothetical protein
MVQIRGSAIKKALEISGAQDKVITFLRTDRRRQRLFRTLYRLELSGGCSRIQ